jgi:hypothetical protein
MVLGRLFGGICASVFNVFGKLTAAGQASQPAPAEAAAHQEQEPAQGAQKVRKRCQMDN